MTINKYEEITLGEIERDILTSNGNQKLQRKTIEAFRKEDANYRFFQRLLTLNVYIHQIYIDR
jgi:hypothetical protein